MKRKNTRCLVVLATVALGCVCFAEHQDRPQGIQIGQRLTLRPYVNFDFTYDSNTDSQTDGEGNTAWRINPALDLTYKSEQFVVRGNAFYGYRAYNDYARHENEHNYGEKIDLTWSNAARDEKGWTILLSERFQKINQDDDMMNVDGRGLWRDRRECNVDGAIQRRFNDKLHADINGSYYYLDYDNDGMRYQNLYGWQRLVAGAEVGYAASKWADIILAGSYQSYTQDNSDDLSDYSSYYGTKNRYARESDGYTVQAGFQSFATEKISYRLLAGWSRFSYGGISEDDGFTYSASLDWKLSDTWHTMLMAQSYYQPSEREFGSANRVDSVSWGLAHSMIRGKLNATFDAAYRRETRVETDRSAYDYDEDIFSFRLGLDYTINRYLAVYARGEYQRSMFGGDTGGIDRDYDRFRVSIGFRLQY